MLNSTCLAVPPDRAWTKTISIRCWDFSPGSRVKRSTDCGLEVGLAEKYQDGALSVVPRHPSAAASARGVSCGCGPRWSAAPPEFGSPARAVRLRQHQRHRLVRLGEAVVDSDLRLFDATLLDGIHLDASHQDFDQPPLQLPRHRLVESLPQLRQKRFSRPDVGPDGIGSGDLAPQFRRLRLQGGLLLADLIHLRAQVGIGQLAAPVQADDTAALRRLLRPYTARRAPDISPSWKNRSTNFRNPSGCAGKGALCDRPQKPQDEEAIYFGP